MIFVKIIHFSLLIALLKTRAFIYFFASITSPHTPLIYSYKSPSHYPTFLLSPLSLSLSLMAWFSCLAFFFFWGLIVSAQDGGGNGRELVPAMFIFGDSLIDNGNNNNLPSFAKANYYPYGIDFSAGPTGRFSNGYTIVDVVGGLSLSLVSLSLLILHWKKDVLAQVLCTLMADLFWV